MNSFSVNTTRQQCHDNNQNDQAISPCSYVHLNDVVKVKFTPLFNIEGKGSTEHGMTNILSITGFVDSCQL